jgi:catechol 2,3-dioxygenase-like lactoylglutathione lyase family enzyme
MISGIHALFYSRQAPAARAFLRDVLGLRFVDSGGGSAPPVELAVHPSDVDMDGPPGGYDLYFMCTNIEETVADLQAKGLPLRAAARREPVQPAVVS